MSSKPFDFLIVGAGIMGLSGAVELALRNHRVCVINPDQIPHPLAASTDISKVVRMEYGTDEEYMDMALDSLEGWRAWNEVFDRPLYHETGFLILTSEPLEYDFESFAGASYINLLKRGYHSDRLNPQLIAAMFPAFNSEVYHDGFFNPIGGYVESGRVIEQLAKYARDMGVAIIEGEAVNELLISQKAVSGVRTSTGEVHSAGTVILCTGNFTSILLPEMQAYLRVTGHPIFHLQPELPAAFMPPDFPVFAADIQNTGWYGFPYHPLAQVVKVANHGIGRTIDPAHDTRVVTQEEEARMRTFLRISIPQLAEAPLVHTRLCCYTDTWDGHFWLDRHPEVRNLIVATGGSGHAFKMGPALGEMIAQIAEGQPHKWSERYSWRDIGPDTLQQEEARYHDRRGDEIF